MGKAKEIDLQMVSASMSIYWMVDVVKRGLHQLPVLATEAITTSIFTVVEMSSMPFESV